MGEKHQKYLSQMAAHTIDRIAGNAKAVRDIPTIFDEVHYGAV